MKKAKRTKAEIKAAYAKLTEQIQSLCTHRRLHLFTEEGRDFVECLDCEKRLCELDI